MRINSYLKALFVIVAIMLTACDNSVDFGEQYKKTLYIVNSNNILYKSKHYFDEPDDYINISIYCAGTEATKSDVTVKLGINMHIFDSINHVNNLSNPLYVNKALLPEANYNFSDPTVRIKAGEEYGLLKIPFNFDGLNPDSSYVLPLSIISNDRDYDINPKLNTILYEIEMANAFSGDYTGSSTELPKTVRSVQPTLKAMSANVVRMPIHTLRSDVNDLGTNFMLLTIAPDNKNVSITPWKDAKVKDLGGSMYNSKKMYFHLNYSFIDENGKDVIVQEKITNLEYEKSEDEVDNDDTDGKLPYLIVSPQSFEKIKAKGDDLVFTLYTDDADWEYSISNNADWLIEKEKTETTLTLKVNENEGDERTATITFNLVSNPTVTKVVEIAQEKKIVPAGIQIFKNNSLTSSSIGSNGYGGSNPIIANINGAEITISGNLINYSKFPNQTMTLTFVPDDADAKTGKIKFNNQVVGVGNDGYTYQYRPTDSNGTYDAEAGFIRFSLYIYYQSGNNWVYWYEDELLIKVD